MTDAEALVARVTEMGGSIVLEAGQLNLVKPYDPYWRERIVKELLPLLVEHKSGLLIHFRALSEGCHVGRDNVTPDVTTPDDPGRKCRACGLRIWLGNGITAADVGGACERIACPYWTQAQRENTSEKSLARR
jgi:hypothetical protein